MPPKGKKRAAPSAQAVPNEEPVPAQTPTLGESLSYLHTPRPFKNPNYVRPAARRTKNLKSVLAAEREKTKQEREKQKEANTNMEVDGQTASYDDEEMPTYTSIEAPPSVLPQKRYCDITGLEAPYTDPVSKLRYHDKSVYELIKTLSPDTQKSYLALRGVNPIVK